MSTKNEYKTSHQTDADKSITIPCGENGCCKITINIACCGKPPVQCEPETPELPKPTKTPEPTPTGSFTFGFFPKE